MRRSDLGELAAFLAVAEERSFTRAAARLGTSQSALSHTVRALEERLEIRLLNRTTRSVAPTPAGERLIRSVGPRLEEIDAELRALGELRKKPAGAIRITTGELAAESTLLPALTKLLPRYPDIQVELTIERKGKQVPVKLSDVNIDGKKIALTVQLMTPQERSALLERIREPYESAAAANDAPAPARQG